MGLILNGTFFFSAEGFCSERNKYPYLMRCDSEWSSHHELWTNINIVDLIFAKDANCVNHILNSARKAFLFYNFFIL